MDENESSSEEPVEAILTDDSSELRLASDVAKEVLAGHWGLGNRRDERLRAAGHDPVVIKQEMSKILNR